MDKERVLTLSQVSQHTSKKDCWLVINGRVLNVTKFLEEHPGGEEVLLESAGKDATKEFEVIGHSKAAKNLLLTYQVGYLQGHNIVKEANDAAAQKEEPKAAKEMKAFVIKEDPGSKHTALVEFFVPLLVAFSYFVYRYLTGAIIPS